MEGRNTSIGSSLLWARSHLRRGGSPHPGETSSPRKGERKVPNILRKSPSKDVKTGTTKPSAKEKESKSKKPTDREKEKKVEKPLPKEQESKEMKSAEKEKPSSKWKKSTEKEVEKPSSKEKESKGKKYVDKEKEKKVEKPSIKEQDIERGLKVAPRIHKKSLSDVLKVQHPEMKKKKPAPTFEQLAADSQKILATLKLTQASMASVASKEKSVSKKNSTKDLKEPTNVTNFGLTRSSFLVFNNKLPFGYFEEDV